MTDKDFNNQIEAFRRRHEPTKPAEDLGDIEARIERQGRRIDRNAERLDKLETRVDRLECQDK